MPANCDPSTGDTRFDFLNPRCSTSTMKIRSTLTLVALTIAGPAFAQADTPPPFEDAWKFRLGVGVGSQPKFPGSDGQRTRAIPVLSAEYGRFFIGGTPGAGSPAGVGVFLLRESGWSVGAGLGATLTNPRKESDSPRLKGFGDVDKTASGSMFVNYDWRWLAVHSIVQTDIGGKKEGTTASLELAGRLPLGTLMLSAGPGLTWADHKYQQTFFGVDAAQSQASGLPAYDAKSGINSVRLNLGANYQISPRWGLGAHAAVGRLTGSATNSPITESKNQNSFALITSYGF